MATVGVKRLIFVFVSIRVSKLRFLLLADVRRWYFVGTSVDRWRHTNVAVTHSSEAADQCSIVIICE